MDRSYELARLAGRVRLIAKDISDVGDALSDLRHFQPATQAYEVSIDLFHLDRELLQLAPQTGVPPAYQDLPDASQQDVPF